MGQVIPFPTQRRIRIVGLPTEGEVVAGDAADHFMTCPVCARRLDMRDLGQVMEHYHDGPPLEWVSKPS